MEKEELLKEILDYVKPLSPEDRGLFISDITKLTLALTLKESLDGVLNKILDEDEKKVA